MKYSIITVNYNNKEGLRKTIESVIHQTFHDFEFIVIDGGSTDGSVEVLKEYDKDISYWVSEPDGGIYQGMNKGIARATGDYLNFLNSGDYFYDEKVLKNTLPHLKTDIVHGKMIEQSTSTFPYLINRSPSMLYLYESSMQHPSCFFRKELFKDTQYDESYRIVSDWKFYIDKLIFQNCSFAFMPVTVAVFEGGGISETQIEKNEAERKDVLEKLFPPRVLQDYERFKGKESPMLDLIPQFNHTYRLEKFILCLVKVILRIYQFFKR